jgi:hypothetical protein
MKKIGFLLLLFVSSFLQAQRNFYKVYTGSIMGAEAVVHLHAGEGHAGGYLYLVRDPRPLRIYFSESSIGKNDSIIIYSSRSHEVSINISGILGQQQIQGNGILYQGGKEIRKGAILLKETNEAYTAFEFVSVSGNTRLPANLKNDSQCILSSSTIWPSAGNNSPLAASIRKLLYDRFSLPPGKEPSVLLPAELQKNLEDWKNGYIKAGVKETENMGMSLSSEQVNSLMVLSESKSVITLAFYSYGYSGGAHGNYSTELFSFDKRTNKRLQLADVLTPAGISVLPQLLSKAARAQFGIPANQTLEQAGLFKNSIPVTQNFWVDNAGLGFWYQPYEIGPFAFGEIPLFIPLAQVSAYIQPAFIKK